MEVYTENFLSSCRNPQTHSRFWKPPFVSFLLLHATSGVGLTGPFSHTAPLGSRARGSSWQRCEPSRQRPLPRGTLLVSQQRRGAEGMAGAGVYLWGPSPLPPAWTWHRPHLLQATGTPSGMCTSSLPWNKPKLYKARIKQDSSGKKAHQLCSFLFLLSTSFPFCGTDVGGGYEEGNTDQ